MLDLPGADAETIVVAGEPWPGMCDGRWRGRDRDREQRQRYDNGAPPGSRVAHRTPGGAAGAVMPRDAITWSPLHRPELTRKIRFSGLVIGGLVEAEGHSTENGDGHWSGRAQQEG